MRFDSDFAPDYWLEGAYEGGLTPFWAYYAELPAGGGGAGYWLGSASLNGPGTLSGGTNPFGIRASLDQSNQAGVNGGCDGAFGGGITTGVEWAIPLAALGNPSGPIQICAMLVKPGLAGEVSNQLLGPVPPGTCALGPAATVNLSSVGMRQVFLIDLPVPVAPSTWGRLKRLYRGATP